MVHLIHMECSSQPLMKHKMLNCLMLVTGDYKNEMMDYEAQLAH